MKHPHRLLFELLVLSWSFTFGGRASLWWKYTNTVGCLPLPDHSQLCTLTTMPSVPSCTGLLPSGNVSANKSFSPLSCFSVRVFSHSNRKETNTRLNPNLRMKLFYKKHYSNTRFYPASTQICISTSESLAPKLHSFCDTSISGFRV